MLKQKSPPKMYRKHAVKAGVYHQTYIDPNTEDVHRETVYISPQYLRQSAWNTMQMMKRNLDVPVCLDHQDDAYPKKTGQWLKDEMKTAVGLMRGVKYDPKREELEYEYEIQDPAIANKIDQGIIKKVSPNFHASFSPGDGTVWNNVIGHLALTFRPKDYRQGSEPMVATVNVTAPKGQQRFSILSVAQDSIIKLVPMYKLPFSVLASMAKKTASGIEFSSADYNFKFKSRPEFIAWLNKRYRHTLKMSVAGKQGHILYFAVIHAPAGGVHINGRRYLGGQFIPNSHVESLPTADRDKIRAGSAEMLKKRAATAGKYVNTDETHKAAIARHAGDHAKAEITPEDKKAAMRRWASLRGYHGDNALQQVAMLAGKESAQLAKLDPNSEKAKHIMRRLRAYHEMGQMAKAPAAAPMKAAASETAPAAEEWAAKDNSITVNGKEVAKYDFDRDSDSFWVDDFDGPGQKSLNTKKEMLDYIKQGLAKGAGHKNAMSEMADAAGDVKAAEQAAKEKTVLHKVMTAKEFKDLPPHKQEEVSEMAKAIDGNKEMGNMEHDLAMKDIADTIHDAYDYSGLEEQEKPTDWVGEFEGKSHKQIRDEHRAQTANLKQKKEPYPSKRPGEKITFTKDGKTYSGTVQGIEGGGSGNQYKVRAKTPNSRGGHVYVNPKDVVDTPIVSPVNKATADQLAKPKKKGSYLDTIMQENKEASGGAVIPAQRETNAKADPYDDEAGKLSHDNIDKARNAKTKEELPPGWIHDETRLSRGTVAHNRPNGSVVVGDEFMKKEPGIARDSILYHELGHSIPAFHPDHSKDTFSKLEPLKKSGSGVHAKYQHNSSPSPLPEEITSDVYAEAMTLDKDRERKGLPPERFNESPENHEGKFEDHVLNLAHKKGLPVPRWFKPSSDSQLASRDANSGGAAPWHGKRPEVMAEMRRLHDELTQHEKTNQSMQPPQGTIGIGGADTDSLVKREVAGAYLSALNKGQSPEEAHKAALEAGKSTVKNWNDKTSKGRVSASGAYQNKRWEGMGDSYADDIHRRFAGLDKSQDAKEAGPVDADAVVKKVFGFGKDDLDKVHQGMFNQDVYAHNESYGKARASARINNHIGSVISDIDKKVKAGTATPEEMAAYDAVEVDKHYGDLRSRLNDLGGMGWQQAMTDDLPKSISADELAPSDSRYTSALRGAGAKADPNAYTAAKQEYESNTKAVMDHQAKLDEIHSQRDKLRDLSYNAERKGRRDLQEKYDKKRDELMEEAGKIGDDKLAAIDKNNASRNKAILSHPELPDFVKYAHLRNTGYTGYVNKDVYNAIEKHAIEHAKKNGHDEDVGRHLAEQLSQGVSLEDPESLKKYLKRSAGYIENQKSAKNEVARMKAIEGYDALDDDDKEKYERRMMSSYDYPQAIHNDVKQAVQKAKEKKESETALEKKLKYDEQLGKEKSSRLKANISKLRSGTADDLPEDHVSEAIEHAVGSQFAPHTNFKPGKNYKAADYRKEAISDHKRYSSSRTMAEKGVWTDGRSMVKVPKNMQDQAKEDIKTGDHSKAPDVDQVFKMADKTDKVPAKVHASYGDGTDENKYKYVIQSEHGHVVVPHDSHHRILSLHPDAVPYLPRDVSKASTVSYRNQNGDIVGVAVPLSNNRSNVVTQAPEVGEKIELGGIAEPGPHKEDAMKVEKSYRGTKVSHPVAGGAELHVTGKSGEYEISGFPGKYKSPAHAVKAAKHILSFAHGMKTASGPLIFKPKGSKGSKDKPAGNAAIGFGVIHAPAGGADAQGKHYLGGQFTPNDAHGSGQRPAKKAVAPVMQQKRSFYTKADAHARNLNLKPVIAQVPGMGQVKQAYQHGNLLVHPSKVKGKWQVTHAPTGKRVGSATYKNDAIRKAYLLHHGLDWNFMGDADAHHKARFEDVAKGSIPRGLDEGSLQPGGITEDHNNQSKRLETWMKHAPNYQQAREKYIASHGSFDENGQLKSISANIDDWRDFIPGYNGINAPDTHAAAKYANERFLDELLTTMKDKGNRKVAILGGGGGSGKGTAVASHFDEREYPVRLDQTSSDYESLMQRVKKIKEHGMEPDLVFIDRKPRDAWHGVVARSANLLEKGQKPRVVPKHIAVQANIDARKVALRIAKEHPDLPLRVIDNHNGYNQSKLLKDRGEIVRHLEGQDYNINEELQEADNHVNDLEKQGKLPGHVAAGLRGK